MKKSKLVQVNIFNVTVLNLGLSNEDHVKGDTLLGTESIDTSLTGSKLDYYLMELESKLTVKYGQEVFLKY